MKKSHPILRVIALALVISFTASDISFAAPLVFTPNDLVHNPNLLQIPQSAAKITEIHSATKASADPSFGGKGASGKFIIHIQDAHTNAGAQGNISKVLEALIQKYHLKTIFLEGGTKDDTLSFLRPLAPKEKREEVAKKYLMSGEINGAEFLNLSSDYDMKLWGVEQGDLYKKNLKNYASIVQKREAVLPYICEIEKRVESLKRQIFPQDMLAFDEFLQKFDKKEKNFTEYYTLLSDYAGRYKINLLGFPHFLYLKTLKEKEDRIDFKKANAEQEVLVNLLFKDEADRPEAIRYFLSRFGKMKSDSLTPLPFYEALFQEAEKKKINAGAFQNLVLYRDYLKSYSALNLDEFLKEIQSLEEEVYKSALGSSEAESYLHQISEYLKVLKKLFLLQSSKDEFLEYSNDRKDVRYETIVLLAFLNKRLCDRGNYADVLRYLSLIEDNRKEAEDFYRTNEERDRVFLDKALKKMSKDKTDIAVLITGGYHTPNLKEMMKKEGVSYAVVTPHVSEETNIQKYEQILLGQLGNDNPLLKKQTVDTGKKSDSMIIQELKELSRTLDFQKVSWDMIQLSELIPDQEIRNLQQMRFQSSEEIQAQVEKIIREHLSPVISSQTPAYPSVFAKWRSHLPFVREGKAVSPPYEGGATAEGSGEVRPTALLEKSWTNPFASPIQRIRNTARRVLRRFGGFGIGSFPGEGMGGRPAVKTTAARLAFEQTVDGSRAKRIIQATATRSSAFVQVFLDGELIDSSLSALRDDRFYSVGWYRRGDKYVFNLTDVTQEHTSTTTAARLAGNNEFKSLKVKKFENSGALSTFQPANFSTGAEGANAGRLAKDGERLFFQEGKKDSGDDTNLAHPENEHPFNKFGLGILNFRIQLSNAFFEALFGNFQSGFLGLLADLVENLGQRLGAGFSKPFSDDLGQRDYGHARKITQVLGHVKLLPAAARLATEEQKVDFLFHQIQSDEWHEFAAYSLVGLTSPANFENRVKALRERIWIQYGGLTKDLSTPQDSELRNTFLFLSQLYLLLSSQTATSYTLTNEKKFGQDALNGLDIDRARDDVENLIRAVENRYPYTARSVIAQEQNDLLRLQLRDINAPYDSNTNQGNGFFAVWAREAEANEGTVNFISWLRFWKNKIEHSNFQKLKQATGGVLGYDYGGVTTKWFVLLGGDFVMMNPTLARRAVRESPELQQRVNERVLAYESSRHYDAKALKWALLREATLTAGGPSRKALYWIYLLTHGQRGQVSLQVDPRKDKREGIVSDIDYLTDRLGREAEEMLSQLVIDSDVLSESDIRSTVGPKSAHNVSAINTVFKVDGSLAEIYGDVLEATRGYAKEHGGSVELAKVNTNGIATEIHSRGIFTNFTGHVGVAGAVAAFLTQLIGNAKAREKRIVIHGSYITQMAGRAEAALRYEAIALVKRKAEELEIDKWQDRVTALTALSKNSDAVNTLDDAGFRSAVDLINAKLPDGGKLVIPSDKAVRRAGAAIIQKTEIILEALREKLRQDGNDFTVNESAQLLASTRKAGTDDVISHLVHVMGRDQRIKVGYFPDPAGTALEALPEEALRDYLKAASSRGSLVAAPVEASLVNELVESSLGNIFLKYYEPNAAEVELFQALGIANPQWGNRGWALSELRSTSFANHTFTGHWATHIPITEEGKDKIPGIGGQFIGDANQWARENEALARIPLAITFHDLRQGLVALVSPLFEGRENPGIAAGEAVDVFLRSESSPVVETILTDLSAEPAFSSILTRIREVRPDFAAARLSAQAALDGIRNHFVISSLGMRNISMRFGQEMGRGLRAEQNATLKMIDSLVPKPTSPATGKFLALDLGGTNFRVLVVELKDGEVVGIPKPHKSTLTDELIKGDRDEFFGFIADKIREAMVAEGLSADQVYPMGFTFAFPINQTSINHGTLIHWSKGFEVKRVEGEDVVELLHQALEARGIRNVKVAALVNDTVGTLAAANGADVGAILGTGTNGAYWGRTNAINTEWGGFDSFPDGVITAYDKELDKQSGSDAGRQILEKMVSGKYLGEVLRLILEDLRTRNLIFRGFNYSALSTPYGFSAKQVSDFAYDQSEHLDTMVPHFGGSSIEDRKIVKQAADLVLTRSARIFVSAVSAILTESDFELSQKHRVAIDGSVFDAVYKVKVREAAAELWGSKAQNIEFVEAKDGSGVGAAIIAAIASSQAGGRLSSLPAKVSLTIAVLGGLGVVTALGGWYFYPKLVSLTLMFGIAAPAALVAFIGYKIFKNAPEGGAEELDTASWNAGRRKIARKSIQDAVDQLRSAAKVFEEFELSAINPRDREKGRISLHIALQTEIGDLGASKSKLTPTHPPASKTSPSGKPEDPAETMQKNLTHIWGNLKRLRDSVQWSRYKEQSHNESLANGRAKLNLGIDYAGFAPDALRGKKKMGSSARLAKMRSEPTPQRIDGGRLATVSLRTDNVRAANPKLGSAKGITAAENRRMNRQLGGIWRDQVEQDKDPEALARTQKLWRVYHDLASPIFRRDVDEVKTAAQDVRDFGFKAVVIVGVGGSDLGARALHQALNRGKVWNELSPEQRKGAPKIYFLSTFSDADIKNLMDSLEAAGIPLGNVLFNIISKSGTTPEPFANFSVVREILRDKLGPSYGKNIIATTGIELDPDGNPLPLERQTSSLYKEAVKDSFRRILRVPDGIGGRYSVFTPVGLFYAAVTGIDIDEILEGLREAEQESNIDPATGNNAAYEFAKAAFLMDTKKGVHNLLMNLWGPELEDIGKWFRQLWAESLGKKTEIVTFYGEGAPVLKAYLSDGILFKVKSLKKGYSVEQVKRADGTRALVTKYNGKRTALEKRTKIVRSGSVPSSSIGSVDNHSIAQQIQHGVRDTLVAFVGVKNRPALYNLPEVNDPKLAYLSGQTLSGLLGHSMAGTEISFTKDGVPNIRFELENLDARTLAKFFYTLWTATMVAGELYDVNAFDQPGVEGYKTETAEIIKKSPVLSLIHI